VYSGAVLCFACCDRGAADLVFLGLTWLTLAGAELLAVLPAIWPGFFLAATRRVFTDANAGRLRCCLLALCSPDFRLAWSLLDEFTAACTAALAAGLGMAA